MPVRAFGERDYLWHVSPQKRACQKWNRWDLVCERDWPTRLWSSGLPAGIIWSLFHMMPPIRQHFKSLKFGLLYVPLTNYVCSSLSTDSRPWFVNWPVILLQYPHDWTLRTPYLSFLSTCQDLIKRAVLLWGKSRRLRKPLNGPGTNGLKIIPDFRTASAVHNTKWNLSIYCMGISQMETNLRSQRKHIHLWISFYVAGYRCYGTGTGEMILDCRL